MNKFLTFALTIYFCFIVAALGTSGYYGRIIREAKRLDRTVWLISEDPKQEQDSIVVVMFEQNRSDLGRDGWLTLTIPRSHPDFEKIAHAFRGDKVEVKFTSPPVTDSMLGLDLENHWRFIVSVKLPGKNNSRG